MANVVTRYVITNRRTARTIKARLPRRVDRVCMATYSQNEVSMPGFAQVVHPFRRPERSQSRNENLFSPGGGGAGRSASTGVAVGPMLVEDQVRTFEGPDLRSSIS